mmetsp:Transcript_1488/g.4410  ORF Transcript_1488/g.4410 Transcript_1488/m.4410 type:complete len:201 (+) Transcript_1488:1156-1758(+)
MALALGLGRPGRWAGLNHVRVQSSLNQEAGLGAVLLLQLLGEVVEHANEAGANGLALLLRVHHPLEGGHHGLRVIHEGDGQMQFVLERLHHPLCLLVAQEPVVHEHAVQAVPQHFVHQGGRHRAVHPAAQGANHVLLRAHHFGDLVHFLLEDILHAPVGRHSRHIKQEVPQQLAPPLAVGHLRVVLQPEQLSRSILYAHY